MVMEDVKHPKTLQSAAEETLDGLNVTPRERGAVRLTILGLTEIEVMERLETGRRTLRTFPARKLLQTGGPQPVRTGHPGSPMAIAELSSGKPICEGRT